MDVSQIASEFQLVCTKISNLEINNDILIYNESDTAERKIDVSYEIQNVGLDEEGDLFGVMSLTINIIIDKGEDNFSLSLIIEGVFSAPAELTDDIFKKMMSINGCAAMYTMARAIISSISTQVFSCGSILTPMVNFIKFRDANKQ